MTPPTPGDYLHDFDEYRQRKDAERQAESATANRFSYVSIDQLLDLPEPRHRFALDGILPAAGSSLLIAKPKVGKSTLAQQLAVAVARGGTFFGKDVRQGAVLYHAFEEQDTEVARAFRSAAVERGLPGYFHFGDAPTDRWEALRAAVEEHRPTLVVIDTLAYWMSIKDFNDYAQVGDALKPLHRFARTNDTHLMAVHHQGKVGESPLGSTALSANVDTIMMLNETDQGRTLETKQRYGAPLPKTLLAFDADTRTLSLGGQVTDARKRDLDEEIMETIGRRTMAQTELQDTIGCRKESLTHALNRLVEAGVLIRTGHGKGRGSNPYMYELAPTYRPEPISPDGLPDVGF